MGNYIIYTDSACDIKPRLLNEWGVHYTELTFTFGSDGKEHSDFSMPSKEFYKRMRDGDVAKTSAVNAAVFKAAFEKELQAGDDVLYIGFSSGLSTTVNSAQIAADELKEQYPERRIVVVDTLAASAGFGLLLYMTVQQKKNGAGLDEAAAYAERMKLHICHWFTVDDLVYLKRGGRISPTVAFVGSVLGIKPVLHMDNEGHLINMFKERGRKASIRALAAKYGELCMDREAPIFISHGDCKEDADYLVKLVKEQYGAKVDIITDVGAVIGAHSGPGTLAFFFVGKER